MIDNTASLNEIKTFIKINSYWIYKYINEVVLKDIGKMNKNYFINSVNNIFFKNKLDSKLMENINYNRLPYEIFPFLENNGKIDYTSLRVETINLDLLDKKASVYYNYINFSIKQELLHIELMQTKIGGMPIDKDIVKFTKKISIKDNGLQEFINQNQDRKEDIDFLIGA